MSAKYRSPSFLLPNELNTSANTANDTGINSLYSMNFDSASSDYIDATISALDNATAITFSGWFKKTSGNVIGFESFVSSTDRIILYWWSDNNVYWSVRNGSASSTASSSLTIYDWNHIVGTFDGATNTIKLYINGSLVDTETGQPSSTSANLSNNFHIGLSNGNTYNNGQIDEVAIFNRALESTEIAALYDGTGSNIRPSNLMATNLNPLAYYPLGEQAQNTGYVGSGDPGNPTTLSNVWQFPNGVLQDYVMDFDGSTDYIDISESNDSLGSLTSGTLSFWIKPATISGTQTIFGYGNTTTTNDFFSLSTFTGGKLRLLFRNDSSGTAWPSNGCDLRSLGVVSVNKWYNICLVSNGSLYTLYLNGSPTTLSVDAGSNSGKWFGDFVGITMNRTLIGAKQSTSIGSYFDGEISNVVLWNSDQSTNIANIYNNGSPQTTYTVTPQNWWKLNATSVYTPSVPNYTTALRF